MTDKPPPKGAAVRRGVDALADLLDAFGHPDGVRLRAALSTLDDVFARHVRPIAEDRDPLAALIEKAAAARRGR